MQHVRHGRTARDAKNLARHLLRREGNASVEVVRIVGIAAADLAGALAAMRRLAPRGGSAAFHHISLSPSRTCATDDLRADADRALREMGADPATHPHALIVHGKTSAAGRAPCHAHLVVAHWSLDGLALKDGWLHLRLERVAREIEHDRGERLTPGRHDRALAKALRAQGRSDVATALEAVSPDGSPRSATTPGARQRLRRAGVDDAAARTAVKTAWSEMTSAADFRTALADAGLSVAEGEKAGVWIVTTAEGVVVGALDRILRQRRAVVAACMEKTDDQCIIPTIASAAPRPGVADPDPGHRPANRPLAPAPRTPRGAGGAEPVGSAARDVGGNLGHSARDERPARPYRERDAPTVASSTGGLGNCRRRVRDLAAGRILARGLNLVDLHEDAARRYLEHRLAVLEGLHSRARQKRDDARAPVPEPATVADARAKEAKAREAERQAETEAQAARARQDALVVATPFGWRRAWWWARGRLRKHDADLAAAAAAARTATEMAGARAVVAAGMRLRLGVAEELAERARLVEVSQRRQVEERATLTMERVRIAADMLRSEPTRGALPVPTLLRLAEVERRRRDVAEQILGAQESANRAHGLW